VQLKEAEGSQGPQLEAEGLENDAVEVQVFHQCGQLKGRV
jgi:hypothetical protein